MRHFLIVITIAVALTVGLGMAGVAQNGTPETIPPAGPAPCPSPLATLVASPAASPVASPIAALEGTPIAGCL
jgi:hypothetical protein